MNLRSTPMYLIAFMAFVFVFTQFHELAHLFTARLVCGCWGSQVDFNLWNLCSGCEQNPEVLYSSIAGPVFSYAMMWFGMLLLSRNKSNLLAFTLIIGNLPFARIITAAMSGGDELSALRYYILPEQPVWQIRLIGFLIVFTLGFPPILACYRALTNKSKGWIIAGYCCLPLLVQWCYQFKMLGLLMQNGILSTQRLWGIADMVHIHTLLMMIILMLAFPRAKREQHATLIAVA